MKVAALLALAGVGFSSEVCRDLKFKTGSACAYGFSTTNFKIMPFDKPIPSSCRMKKGSVCTVEVCGTNAQFAKDLKIQAVGGKVNSWNFDLYVDDLPERIVPKSICTNAKKAFCCSVLTRLDGDVRSAEYVWPATGRSETDSPTGSPSEMPTSRPSDMPSVEPTHSPTGAPTSQPSRSPTAALTDEPSPSPSPSPTTMSVTLAPTMGKPCKFMKEGECRDAEFCNAQIKNKRGKKTFTCVGVKCKKFKKKPSKCEEAPHCKPGKFKGGKMSKCQNKK